MKKGLVLLALVVAVLFAACSKETSIEKATQQNQENTWSFSVGSTQYGGTVDTTYSEDLGLFQFINLEGFSGAGTGQLLMSFGGSTLQVGEYVFPFANLFYAENGEIIFESVTENPDFRIVITEINADRVVGTFAGTVVESQTGNPITISNGRFSARR